MRKRLGFQELVLRAEFCSLVRKKEGLFCAKTRAIWRVSFCGYFFLAAFSSIVAEFLFGFVLFCFFFVGAFWAMEEVIEEELMALESIFYDSYSKLSDNRFRIRIDPDVEDEGGGGDLPPPLFLEVLLPEGYPETLPQFDVSNINNRKYPESVKSAIVEGLLQQVC